MFRSLRTELSRGIPRTARFKTFVVAAAVGCTYAMTSPVAHADECQAVTALEVVHRAGSSQVTTVVRLEPGAAADPQLALRSFQVAANHFGQANIVSTRPIAEVHCFPDGSTESAARPPTFSPASGGLCVNPSGVSECTDSDPTGAGRFPYPDGANCTATSWGNTGALAFRCDDSGIIVTRAGDVVVTVNSDNARAEVLARTQALRRLLGDANVLTNFHFNIILSPDQQAALVGNDAFTDVANAIQRAADRGQPLPDIEQLLLGMPEPPTNLAFFAELAKAYELRQERLQLMANITSGARLSPSQVNAFYQNFIGRSQRIDQLVVERTANSLSRAADLVDETITQLVNVDPASTIYEEVKAFGRALLEEHTNGGVFDPDGVVQLVPPLTQLLTDDDMEKRILAGERLVAFNEMLRREPNPQHRQAMEQYLTALADRLNDGDWDDVFRVYDQVLATEFFLDHDDPTGTTYDVRLTPDARSLFNIQIEPTSAVNYDVILLLNEVADYNRRTGQLSIDYQAIIQVNARAALATPDVIRQLYHTEEGYGWFDVATGALSGFVNGFGDMASGIFHVVTHPFETFEGIKAAVINWQDTLDLVWQQGAELIHRWPNMTPAEKAEFMGRVAAEIVAGLPGKARQVGRIGDAARDAVRLHMDKAGLGLRLVERSGVALSPQAATELVTRMERLGVTSVDEIIAIADGIDDALPCQIVGNRFLQFRIAAIKPPCGAPQIAAIMTHVTAQAKSMGAKIDVEIADFIMSTAKVAPPGQVIPKALDSRELRFATEIITQKGGVYVGPWRAGLDGIDGFYNGRPIQQKVITPSSNPLAVLDDSSIAERKARNAGYNGVSFFVRAENVERDELIDFARRGALMGRGGLLQITRQGIIHSIDVLVKDGHWVHIEGGQIR